MGFNKLSGASLQEGPNKVASVTREWVERSAASGHKWVVTNDEQGNFKFGVEPDDIDPNHTTIRKKVLWGNLMNKGGGVEYYFGYQYPESDLTLQNFRSRDRMWTISKFALDFFQNFQIPFWTLTFGNTLVTVPNTNWCLTSNDDTKSTIIIYLQEGGSEEINLTSVPLSVIYDILWYDPLNGGILQKGSIPTIVGGSKQSIGQAPSESDPTKDWVVLIRKK